MKFYRTLKAGERLALLIFLLCVGSSFVKCQIKEPLHSTLHKDTIQQQDEIRFMFVTVTEKNGNLVYFYRDSGKLVEVSYMFWDEQSVIKDSAKEQFKGCYGVLYCLQHKYIYWLQRMPCTDSKGSFYFTDH